MKRVFGILVTIGIGVLFTCFYKGKEVNRKVFNSEVDNVTIRFMSNLPDRTSGQGKVEQALADKYTEEHPNVKIEFETLQDVAFQQKFKVYIASNNIPDIYMTWVSSLDFLDKISAELNASDFTKYSFMPGALETRMRNGKLYGVPVSNDMYLLYYNRELFERYHIKVPSTFQELIEASKNFRANGIIPCATNGKEKWELSGIYNDLYYRVHPEPSAHTSNWDNATYGKDPGELKAAKYYKQLMDVGFFQDGFVSSDYGTAKDIFTQGKAAMYYMGSWELGMANDPNLSDIFKKNLAAICLPPIDGEAKDVSVLANWYGGGYSVWKDSKVKNESIEFLKYFFKPENWAQMVWDNGACVAPQQLRLNGNENELMKSVYNILSNTQKFEGEFNSKYQRDVASVEKRDDLFQQFSLGLLTPEQFIKSLDEGLKNSRKDESELKQ